MNLTRLPGLAFGSIVLAAIGMIGCSGNPLFGTFRWGAGNKQDTYDSPRCSTWGECHGFHSTCWDRWPEECATCPPPVLPERLPTAMPVNPPPPPVRARVADEDDEASDIASPHDEDEEDNDREEMPDPKGKEEGDMEDPETDEPERPADDRATSLQRHGVIKPSAYRREKSVRPKPVYLPVRRPADSNGLPSGPPHSPMFSPTVR